MRTGLWQGVGAVDRYFGQGRSVVGGATGHECCGNQVAEWEAEMSSWFSRFVSMAWGHRAGSVQAGGPEDSDCQPLV